MPLLTYVALAVVANIVTLIAEYIGSKKPLTPDFLCDIRVFDSPDPSLIKR
jgi:hypothetical protein